MIVQLIKAIIARIKALFVKKQEEVVQVIDAKVAEAEALIKPVVDAANKV